jgi:hypothetical protein
MEIKTADYQVSYDSETNTLSCKGSLRLSGMDEYAPIVELFHQVAALEPPLINVDLKTLEFLNSSGINVLSKFIIKVRQKKIVKMVVQGSKQIPWQGKSLKNLQRLMPNLQLEWE